MHTRKYGARCDVQMNRSQRLHFYICTIVWVLRMPNFMHWQAPYHSSIHKMEEFDSKIKIISRLCAKISFCGRKEQENLSHMNVLLTNKYCLFVNCESDSHTCSETCSVPQSIDLVTWDWNRTDNFFANQVAIDLLCLHNFSDPTRDCRIHIWVVIC